MAARKADFVARDHELESAHEKTTEELAAHRWHWTLDESNPERLSLKEYARRISRGYARVHAMANGYAAWKAGDPELGIAPGAPVKLIDFVEQAKMGADKAAATQAVAAATGLAYSTVTTGHRAEVRQVLATAQDRAERKGTTVSEELPAVAEWRQKARVMEKVEREAKTASPFRLVSFEGDIGSAIRHLRKALAFARDIDFTDEEIELMEGSLTTLRTLIQLIDVRISGESGIDWDASFAAAMKETP